MKIRLMAIVLVLGMLNIIAGCGGSGENSKIKPTTIPENTDLDNRSRYDYDSGSENLNDGDNKIAPEMVLFTVHFEYDQFDLNKKALDTMSENAQSLWDHPNAVIRIEGHCDERGTEEYNLALGEKRARAVLDYLVKYGINTKRVSVISYGESMPVVYGTNEKSWAQNRRAQFVVLSE